jgi:hypothetical protein
MSKFASLKRRYDTWSHDRLCRAVLQTPPIIPQDDAVILFSMMGTAVLLPYLVAVKSLHHHLQRGRVVIIDDGTLTPADKAVLAHHCGAPQILSIHDVTTAPCPRGGTWERLLTILDLRADGYIIQLDSDTVTLGPVPEIAAAIDANLSFSIAGGEREAPLGFMTVPDFAAQFYPGGEAGGHVQSLLESKLATLGDAANRRYARACSGFAGFARGGPGRETAEDFSRVGESLTGGRWDEWGTEQITSNYVIANEPGSTLLRYDRYMNYWASPWGADTRFVHFVGAHRFDNRAYAAATKAAIRALG